MTASSHSSWLDGWLAPLSIEVDGRRGTVDDPTRAALSNLGELTGWRQAIDTELIPRYVAAARNYGASWVDVADQLDVSPRAARARFGA